MRSVLTLTILAASCLQAAEADSVIEIVGNLKTFRDAVVEMVDVSAVGLAEAGRKQDAEKFNTWSNDWLSVLGLNKGLTGLTKDFVLNYLGRDSYHSQNGPLIDAVHQVAAAFPRKGRDFDQQTVLALRDKLLDVCEAGVLVFDKAGSLHQMLTELQLLLKEENTKYLAKGMKATAEMRKAFEYIAGPRPGDEL